MAETTEIVTVVKMMERLPEATQKRVVEHLRDYLAEIDEDAEWDALFASTEPALVAEAQRVRAQIEPMDYDRL